MDYRGKIVGVTGAGNGFIADQLFEALEQAGAIVEPIIGDIRNPETFDVLNYKFDYLFHFAAPSSQILFKQNPTYCIDTTVNGFINAQKACNDNGIRLIYPSTGILSQGDTNEYARCKQLCEDMASPDSLGIRIFATYGPTENHKRDFASVPYLFARDMVNGKSPIVFGDGEQVRDFIHIEDVVRGILIMAEESNLPIVELGNEQKSFNQLIHEINLNLPDRILPVYVDSPTGYVEKTQSKAIYDNWSPKVSFKEGIRDLVKELYERD